MFSVDGSGSLIANGLETGYRSGRRTRVISRVDLTVSAGSVVAVVGPNGAGKTTLLKTLVGLLQSLAGTITLGGVEVALHRRQHGIGYLPESIALPEHWTGRGLLSLAALAAGDATNGTLHHALAAAGVDFDIALPIARMSKGMRQRLVLALVLIPQPALLLLDEPEAGLDPAQRVRLRERIVQLAQAGCIVLVASHDVTGICTIAHQNYLLSNQTLVQVSRDDLLDPQRVVRLFQNGAA